MTGDKEPEGRIRPRPALQMDSLFAHAYDVNEDHYGDYARLVRNMLHHGAALLWRDANAAPEEEMLVATLPAGYSDRYTEPLMIDRWRLTVATVSWKLAQPARHEWVTLAEYLALRGVVQEAKYLMEGAYQDGSDPLSRELNARGGDPAYDELEAHLDAFYDAEEDRHGTTLDGLVNAKDVADVPNDLRPVHWWLHLDHLDVSYGLPHPLTGSNR